MLCGGRGGVSPWGDFARCDGRQGLLAFDLARFLKKAGQKLFTEKFFICFGAVPLSVIGLLFFVSFYDGRNGTADSILGPLPKMLHQDS